MKGHVEKKLIKGKARYYPVIELDRGPDGKRRRKWLDGYATKGEAKTALAKAQVQVDDGTFIEPNKQTVADFFTQWISDKELEVRYNTWKKYRWLTTQHVIPNLGHIQLLKLSAQHLQKLYSDLQRKDEPLSKRSILHLHNMIHNALERAVGWGLMPRNVADLANPPKPEHTEIQTWAEEDATTFLAEARNVRYYMVFLIAITTGMRKEEVCALRWSDVDWDNKRLQVRQALVYKAGKGYAFEDVKTAKSRRDVAIDGQVLAELRRHKASQAQERLALGAAYHDHDLINARTDGNPVAYETLHKQWKRSIESAGVPDIRFHDLRHTHVTLLFEMGVSSKEIAERVGHSRTTVTDDIYTHVKPKRHGDIADRFGQRLFGQK